MTYHSTTTLGAIRDAGPCGRNDPKSGFGLLLTNLGQPLLTFDRDVPVTVLTILESNGLDDALWCLRAPSLERLSRHFQAWCAEQVLPFFEAKHPEDMRVREQIIMLRCDDASTQKRVAARDAAWVAAWDAARVAARDAARVAARDAAWDAARVAAWDAAWDAARVEQERQLRKMLAEV
ncbi:MAG: hypothetical protein ACRCWF_05560 [Beijerinckiaceae bacterium]